MKRPSLPSAVAYVALAGLLAETRLELASLRASESERRELGERDDLRVDEPVSQCHTTPHRGALGRTLASVHHPMRGRRRCHQPMMER